MLKIPAPEQQIRTQNKNVFQEARANNDMKSKRQQKGLFVSFCFEGEGNERDVCECNAVNAKFITLSARRELKMKPLGLLIASSILSITIVEM
jgi:hypothetical protein